MPHQIVMTAIMTLKKLDSSVKEQLDSQNQLVFEGQIDSHHPSRLYIFEVDEKNIEFLQSLKVGMYDSIAYISTTQVSCENFNAAILGIFTRISDALNFLVLDRNVYSTSVDFQTIKIAWELMDGVTTCLDKTKNSDKSSSESDEKQEQDEDNEDKSTEQLIQNFFEQVILPSIIKQRQERKDNTNN